LNLQIPYFTHPDIGKKAQDFLSEYHSSFELPIPIEEIIDVKMGLDIVPFPNLYRDYGLSGYLSQDRTTIFVDQFQSDNYEEKFRFTLAHELGHFFLHRSFYEDLPFRSPDEYVTWRKSIPTTQLQEVCCKVVAKHQDKFATFAKVPDGFWSYASNEVATYFEVNPPVVEIRIKKEKIPAKIKIGV
jgi:hypothetical protein